MPKPLPAPSAEYLTELIQEAQTRYRAFHERCNQIERLRQRKHPIYVPENYRPTLQEIRMPTVDDGLRRAASILTEGRPVVSITPLEQGPRANDRANRMEAGLNAIFERLEQQTGADVFRRLMDAIITYGVGYLFCEYMPDAFLEFDEARLTGASDEELDLIRKQAPLPWLLYTEDPRSVYVFRDRLGIREVLIGKELTRLKAARDFGKILLQNNTGNGDLQPGELGTGVPAFHDAPDTSWGMVKVWTHWDRTWVSTYADGKVLKRRKHNYRNPPVFEARGMTTSSDRPEEAFQGIMNPIVDLVPALDALLTMYQNWCYLSAFPMGWHEVPADAVSGITPDYTREPLQWNPGAVISGQPGEKFEWKGAPDIGQSVQAQIKMLTQIIENTTTMPPILKGYAPGADPAGYALNQMRQEARVIFEPLLGNAGFAYQQLGEYLLWSIAHQVEDAIFVVGTDPRDQKRKRQTLLELKPDDVKNYGRLAVSIKRNAPTRDAARAQIGAHLWQIGLISFDRTHEEYLDNANPRIEWDAITREKFMRSPQMMDMVLQEMISREQIQTEVDEAAAASGQPVQGPGGAPLSAPAGPPAGGPPPGAPPVPFPGGPEGPTVGPGMGAPPVPGGGIPGAVPGMEQTPNTQMQPGGFPV